MNNDTLSSYKISQHISDEFKNTEIVIFDSVDSTNNIAKKSAFEGALHRTVIIADEQTNGKGRQGKSFFSPASCGIYMSIILRPDKLKNTNILYTVCAAVAVSYAIEKLTDKSPKIKWVNDIFLDSKKICGILCEAVPGKDNFKPQAIVTGIGINFTTGTDIFPNDLKNIASSLSPNGLTRNELIAEIINNFFTLTEITDNNKIISEYKQRCFVLGREVCYKINSKEHMGIAVDINESGNLIVNSGNETVVLNSGEISCRVL